MFDALSLLRIIFRAFFLIPNSSIPSFSFRRNSRRKWCVGRKCASFKCAWAILNVTHRKKLGSLPQRVLSVIIFFASFSYCSKGKCVCVARHYIIGLWFLARAHLAHHSDNSLFTIRTHSISRLLHIECAPHIAPSRIHRTQNRSNGKKSESSKGSKDLS